LSDQLSTNGLHNIQTETNLPPKPEKPKRPDKIVKKQNKNEENNEDKLISELSKSFNNRKNKITEENTIKEDENVPKKDYSTINEIETELDEIQKRTKSSDPNSAFAIAMSAKHKTLTKRRIQNRDRETTTTKPHLWIR
jgi:hypothetical protein